MLVVNFMCIIRIHPKGNIGIGVTQIANEEQRRDLLYFMSVLHGVCFITLGKGMNIYLWY